VYRGDNVRRKRAKRKCSGHVGGATRKVAVKWKPEETTNLLVLGKCAGGGALLGERRKGSYNGPGAAWG